MELNPKDFFEGSFGYKAFRLGKLRDNMGVAKLSKEDIDALAQHPEVETVAISGLYQDTFEYFIRTYGHQLKAICFANNKYVEDWSLLGTLPQLEYVYWHINHRIETLWDMSRNFAMKGLVINDFSRLRNIDGIEKAPALRYFYIGNGIWLTTVIDSLMPLANTGITHLEFYGKKIADGNLSFFETLPELQSFNCPTNLLTTEQFAWIAANCPKAQGRGLKATEDGPVYNSKHCGAPGTYIVGKRKPALAFEDSEARIQKYIDAFEAMKEKYRGVPFGKAFPNKK